MKTTFRLLITTLLSLVMLAGCSKPTSEIPQSQLQPPGEFTPPSTGSSSSSGAQKPSGSLADTLVVDAGRMQFADSNLLVELDGKVEKASDDKAEAVSASWTQIAGPTAFILSPNSLKSLVLMPEVEEKTALVFELKGENQQALTSRDTTTVFVFPQDGARLAWVVSSVFDENSNELVFTIKLNKPAEVTTPIRFFTTTAGWNESAARDGIDFQGVAEAQPYTVQFAPREQVKQVSLNLNVFDDSSIEGHEFFYLNIEGEISEDGVLKRFKDRAVAVIKDDEWQPTLIDTTTKVNNEGPSNLGPDELPGDDGVVRTHLTWEEGGDEALRLLVVASPCNRLIIGAGSESGDCNGAIWNVENIAGEGSWAKNIIWPERAPKGSYSVLVEHLAGPNTPVDFDLRLFIDGESHWFSGTLDNGETLEVYSYDLEEDVVASSSSSSEVSSSTSSTSSFSESSTSSNESSTSSIESSTSSNESSTNSSESSTSSNESSTSSEIESSSSSNESSESSDQSSSDSSSSTAKPQIDLVIQFDDLEESVIADFNLSITGQVSYDPLFPITNLSLVASVSELGELDQITLVAGEDWDPETGLINTTVNLGQAFGQIASLDLQLRVLDAADRRASSTPFQRVNYRPYIPASVRFIQPLLEEGLYSTYDASLPYALEVDIDGRLALGELQIAIFANQESVEPILSATLGAEDYDPELDLYFGRIDISGLPPSNNYWVAANLLDSQGQRASDSFNLSYQPLALPQLALTAPEPGEYFNAPVNIAGSLIIDSRLTAADIFIQVTPLNGEALTPVRLEYSGESFSWLLPSNTPAGTYDINVWAVDEAEQRVDADSVRITFYPASELTVELTEPESIVELFATQAENVSGFVRQSAGLPLNNVTVSITELQSEAIVELAQFDLLNSEFWNVEEQSFNFLFAPQSYDLSEGNYDLFIRAEDIAGNNNSASFSFSYLIPSLPDLIVTAPQSATYINLVPVAVSAEFDARLTAQLQVQVFEVMPELDVQSLAQLPVAAQTFDLDQSESINFAVDDLASGNYQLQLSLVDSLGQVSDQHVDFSLRRSVLPQVSISQPEQTELPPVFVGPAFAVSGTVGLDPEASLSELSLVIQTLDGGFSSEALSLINDWNSESKEFSYQVDPLALELSYGAYEIVIRAIDSFGNEGSARRRFDFSEALAPSVEWITPPQQSYNELQNIDLLAQFTWDPQLTASAWVQLQALNSESAQERLDLNLNADGSAEIQLANLVPGSYEIVLVIEDELGQQATSPAFSFEIYSALAPQIQLLSPELNEGSYSAYQNEVQLQAQINLGRDAQLQSLSLNLYNGEQLIFTQDLLAAEAFDFETGLMNYRLVVENYADYRVELEAEDSFNLAGQFNFDFSYLEAEPATIALTNPISGASFYELPIISGEFSSDTALPEPNILASLLISDGESNDSIELVPVINQGMFTLDLSQALPAQIESGAVAFSVTVSIRDAQGHQDSDQASYQLLAAPPVVINWLTPSSVDEVFESTSAAIALDISVALDPSVALSQLKAWIYDGEQSLGEVNLLEEGAWAEDKSSLSFELNFNQLELDGGEYQVYIEAQTAFGQYQSETLNLRYIDEASLNISVIQPEQGALYLNDVDITGDIASSEFLRAVSGQASFEPLITDDLDQVAALAVIDGNFVELAIDGDSFSGAIPQQQLSDGRYRLSITLYDQFDRPSNTVVREFDYIRPALTVDLVHDYEVGEGGIELISDLQFTALLNFSHFSLEPQQFILQILDGNTWLDWQAFSPEQVAWNGESANFNLSLEGLEFGPVIMRVLVDYASRNQTNIYQGSSDELGLYYRDVQSPSITWTSAPEGRYPSAQSISFSATTTVDVALSLSPRVVMTVNGEQSEILDYVFEDGVISGALPAPLAIGQYQLQIFVEDGMQQQASTTPAEFEVYLAEGIQIDLLSPQLSEGVYSSVKPGLNLRAKIFHDPAAQLSGLVLKVVGFSEGEFELDSFNLLESENFNLETGELDITLDIRDYEINSGNFELRLSAQDNFANQSSLAFEWWVRQAQAPLIEFTQPQASFYLSPPTIEGNYQLDPELVVETLQVEMAQLGNEIIVYQGLASEFNQGSFTAALGDLANGTYDLRVSLIDDLGQQANDEVQFQFNDLSSVQLVLTDPQTEDEQPAFVSLYGDFDFAGVASLDPSLNFETLELVISAMGAGEDAVVEDVVNLDLIASEIYQEGFQTFRANISLEQWQLPAGQYQLQLRAIVAGQSFSSNSLNVEYIDPIQPSVTIESPIQGQIFYGDIGFTALASVDPRSDFMVSAQLLDANGGVVSAMPVVQQDLDKIEGLFLAAPLFSGSYQLSLSITDDFGQVSEPVIVPLRYVIPGGRIDLLHDYPLNDQEQIEVVEPLFIQAQVELNDASLNVVGFDLELFVDGQWQLLESFQEPVAELDWDGENAYFAIDLNDYEISYGAYQLRISLTSNANTRLSSDPVLILYRALENIELEILNPQQGSYFRPISIEVRASGDPLIALDLTATLSGANSSAGGVNVNLEASEGGDIFTASPDLDPGAYVLEVEARYPGRDQSQFDQVSFNFINPEVGIEVVHQLPVVDDAIDTLGLLELGLELSILPSYLIIESFELEAQINDVWTSLETYDLLAANFFDNANASLMLDLREVSIESSDAVLIYSLLNMRAKVNYEGQGVATSPEFLVNFRPAQAVNINITSPQNGDQSPAGFFVNFDYAIDPLLTPVQVVAQVLHADGSSLSLDQIPVLEAPAGTLGFELGADELHWGANQIVLTATDASGAQARAERSVNYLLSAPQVELINPNDGVDFSSEFSLELNFGLDSKIPLATEEAEIIVQIDEQTIERNVSLLAEAGAYSIEFYPSDFTEGFHSIGVLVVDPRNQDLIGEDTLDINFNFAPELEIIQPSSDEDVTYLRAVPVQFQVSHPAQLGLSDIKVWINQQALDLSLTPQLGTGLFTIPTSVLIADSVNTLSMQATAINGLSSAVVSEQFLYRQPQELSVAFTQPEPVNNEWFLESVSASIELRAQVQGEGSASTSIPELSIQQVDGRSADYQGEVLIDELTGEYIYKLDMNELDFAYGDFELYLTVADSLDRTAQSDVLSLLYRPLQTPQLIMLEPDSEVVNSDSDVNVVISYSLDPLAGSAQLVGSIINGNQEVFEFLNSFVSGSDQLSFPMDADVLTIGTNIVSFSLLDGLDSELSVGTQINYLPLQPEVKVLVPGEDGLLPNADPRVLLNINFDSSKLPVVNPVESLPVAGSLNGQSFEGQLLAVDQSPDGEQLYALNLNTDLLWETFSQDADFSNFLSFSVSDPRSAEAGVDVSIAFNYNHKPIIELNAPQAGEIPSVVGDYRAYFTVKSGLGARVPASNIEMQRNGEVITASIIQSEVGYEALIPAEQMIEGEQTFTLIATSVNGVSSEPVSFNLSYRTPKTLKINVTQPELEQVFLGGLIQVAGTVEFDEEFDLSTLELSIYNRNTNTRYFVDNDLLANGGSEGSTFYFSGRYAMQQLDLPPGTYPLMLRVLAVDKLNRRVAKLIEFEYRIPQATSVNIIRPAPNSEQVNGLEIAADVFKDEGLEVQVQAEIRPIDPGSNQQELTLDMQLTSVPDLGPAYFTSLAAGQLLPGEYLLSVVAKDSLDREERAETRFTYRDLRAPEVKFIARGPLVGSSPLEIDLDINLDAVLPLDQLNLEAIYTTQGTQTFPVAAIAIGETYAPLEQVDGSRYRMAVDQAMLYDGTTQFTLRVCDPRVAGLCSDNILFSTSYQLPELRLLNYGGEGPFVLAGQFVAEYQLDPFVLGANLTAQIYYADGSVNNFDIPAIEDGAEEGISEFYINDSQLRQGTNRIVVSLNDGRNQVQAQWSKDFDPPIVQISYPKQNQQMQGEALLEFTVEYSGVDEALDYSADLILSLDGVVYNDLEALPNSSGQYVFDLAKLELTDGDHNLSLQVSDFRNASVISEPTSRSFNYRNALPELNFNFQPPFFDNNEFLFLLKHNPDVSLTKVSLLLAGEELSDLGIDNLDTASGEIPFALPFNTLRNQALLSSEVGLGNFPITLIAEFEGGFTESAELNFEWGDETAQPVKVPSLVADLFGYSFVWGGSEEHNIYLTYKDFSENQSFNIEESQGNSDYFFNFESLSTTILPNLDQADQARQRVVFGPDVRPADVLLALVNESGLSFHLTRSQDLYDIPTENFDHRVLNFVKQPTALDAMVFADGTVWDSEEILRRASSKPAQFTFAMSIGGHTINREGNATFNFGNPNPSTANFTNRKLLVDGVDVQASTAGNLNYPFDKLQALLGDKEQSRIVELTLEASNDGLYSRDTGVLFLYRGDARYPIANETREVVAFNMGEQGQVSATTAGDMTFDAGFEGAKTFISTGEDSYFYFRDKKAVDTIRLPSPDLPVPNFRYGSFGFSFEIQPDDVEFFRPQNSNDLYVSHVSRNPAMWQIVTNFFSYQKVPLYRLHYFQGPSPTPTFDYNAKPAYWTTWYDRDESSGNGDYELIDQIGLDCRPVAMEARLVKGEVIYVPGADTPDVLQNFDVKSGLACANDDQVDGECGDYEVRFLCEGQDPQSLSFIVESPVANGTYDSDVLVSAVVRGLLGSATGRVLLNGSPVTEFDVKQEGSITARIPAQNFYQYPSGDMEIEIEVRADQFDQSGSVVIPIVFESPVF